MTDAQDDRSRPDDGFIYDPLAPDPVGAGTAPTDGAVPTATPASDDSTVGTGTSIALGCVVGTLLLIVIALIILGINTLI